MYVAFFSRFFFSSSNRNNWLVTSQIQFSYFSETYYRRYMHFIGCNFIILFVFFLFWFASFVCGCFFSFALCCVRFLCTEYTISIFWASLKSKHAGCAPHLHKSNHSRVQIRNSLGSFVSHSQFFRIRICLVSFHFHYIFHHYHIRYIFRCLRFIASSPALCIVKIINMY